MTKKYKLTKEKIELDGKILYRIQALKDFNDVKKGDKGGWIEKKENLSQEGNAWIYDEAKVCGSARVYDNATVGGDALIFGNVRVYDNAKVCGNAIIGRNARIFGNAIIEDRACIYGRAEVCGDAMIWGNTLITKNIRIKGGIFYGITLKSKQLKFVNTHCYDGSETLAVDPEIESLGEEEKPTKRIRIKLQDGQILEGEIIEE